MGNKENIDNAQKNLMKKLTEIRTVSAINTFNAIIIASPVKIGTFRGNWQATINAPYEGVLTTVAIENVPGKIANNKLADNLYLTNNLPYAVRLEEGWSKQRGAGWVKKIAMEAQKELNKANAKVGNK